ncbi:hypothetical protein [Dongia sp.]|uniref:hypothetical protein n=1 Tax=Dongia sp. TaxID=1977262 RepID=UPI0035B39BC2
MRRLDSVGQWPPNVIVQARRRKGTACPNRRRRFAAIFAEIDAHYSPRYRIETDALADMVSAIVEGAIVVSKALKEPQILSQQIPLLRSYVQMRHGPAPRRSALPALEAGGEVAGGGADMHG